MMRRLSKKGQALLVAMKIWVSRGLLFGYTEGTATLRTWRKETPVTLQAYGSTSYYKIRPGAGLVNIFRTEILNSGLCAFDVFIIQEKVDDQIRSRRI